MFSAASNCASRITSGVFPAPPTDKLPNAHHRPLSVAAAASIHDRRRHFSRLPLPRRAETKKREGPNHAPLLERGHQCRDRSLCHTGPAPKHQTARARPLPRQRQDLRADPRNNLRRAVEASATTTRVSCAQLLHDAAKVLIVRPHHPAGIPNCAGSSGLCPLPERTCLRQQTATEAKE